MPDDELDSGGNLVGTNPLDDYDEFLPSTSTNVEASEKTLSKLQDEDEDEEDEFASSLMAAAKGIYRRQPTNCNTQKLQLTHKLQLFLQPNQAYYKSG